jgi:ATP-dependent DNA helicase RecG
MQQTQFDFDLPFEGAALWTPRDIWVKLNQRLLEYLREDRRIERKDHKSPSLDDLAKYYSTFSNTPDGGVLVYGIADKGDINGCGFSTKQINSVENCHISHCLGIPAHRDRRFRSIVTSHSGAS